MLIFYKKALALLLALLVLSALAAYWALERTFSHQALLPSEESGLPWRSLADNDASQGGESSVVIEDDRYSLDFVLTLSDAAEYPFAGVVLNFVDAGGEPVMPDLSAYSQLAFNVKCTPANVLSFSAQTFEKGISKAGESLTYRSPMTYFSCDEQWSRVTLDLTRLETPEWWLDEFELKLSMSDYTLDQVPQLVFGTTHQSPMAEPARVQINDLILNGREWGYLYALSAFLCLIWVMAGIWLFREHTRALTASLKSKLQKDQPLVAYQQLTVEPRRDRDKDAILRYMATEYANSELNLEAMVKAIGVSRTKINSILKAELGFTFTGYLNKVRLTEAARLLSAGGGTSIAEIAYSVGYRNVSYFNKLFKDEYGCTPRMFKNIYRGKSPDS